MDPLFPALPEDLTSLTDEELSQLLTEHETAAQLIDDDNEEFLKGMSEDETLEAYAAGVDQIDLIRAEQQARVDAQEAYQAKKAELAARRKGPDETDEVEELAEDETETEQEETVEVLASEDETEEEETEVEETAPVVAAAEVRLRRPPAPSKERQAKPADTIQLVASAGLESARAGATLTRVALATVFRDEARRWGRPTHHERGTEERRLVARADYKYDDAMVLSNDPVENERKIRAIMPPTAPLSGNYVASGGLCAPLTPIYTLPNFASEARPVRDSLPSFQADRGGANVPAAPYIGDITDAISVITADEDGQGGTFATKSCQDLECLDYTDVPVTVIAHCREYGNLNARAWPERIALENDLTMAAHARTAEGYLLDRIKAQSINVTNGAETLGALIYLVDGIVKSKFGIQSRLRMDRNARFRVLLPAVLPGLLALDTVQTQFDRFRTEEQLVAYLRGYGIEPTFYLDTPSTGTSQIADSAQTAAAIDPLPDLLQWAIFPEGGFVHIDGGSLELGIVRDSTLNSTNDFQVFGETFENVARLAPAQAAYWVTSDLCASGQFPPAGTARTCD